MERTHYQILGLEPAASKEAITTALQQLSDQAAVLVYTSPQRSHELWERIRHIREDLLLDPERRAAYDRSLPAARVAVPAGAETLAAPPPLAEIVRRRAPQRGGFIWRTLGSAAVLALAVALFVVFGHRSRTNRPPGPLALALSSTGLQHRYQYVSGQIVHLRWSRVPQALVYRVQIATALHLSPERAVFAHPALTRLTLGTAYSIQVLGPQVYYWRVQAYIRDAWSPYTRAQHFVVARPHVREPVPQAPPIRIARAPVKTPSHPVVAAVVRRSRVRAASRSGRILPRPESPRTAPPVRQVAALVTAHPRVPRPAAPPAARVSASRPVSPRPTRPTPPSPTTAPAPPSPPRPPVAASRPTPAPAPKSPVHPPAPPVSPPAGTAAPRPPATVSPTPPPSSPPAGSVTYPVARAPVTAAPLRSPLSPVAPTAPPDGTVGQGTAISTGRPVSASVSAPTAQPAPAYWPPPRHHAVSGPHGSGAPAASTDASSDD